MVNRRPARSSDHRGATFKSVLGALSGALLASLLGLGAGALHAQQAYPSKPIRLIVPFPPGGGSDPVARILAQGLSTRLGQQVFVDNRPGAQGSIGTAIAAKSPADGYTVLLFVGALAADPWVAREPAFDPVKDFSFVTLVTSQPSLAVTSPNVPAANLREFVALAKAKPDGLSFAYGSTSGRLIGELLMQLTGIKMIVVPYKGAGAAITDVAGGRVDLAFTSPPSSIPLIKAGRIKGLAVVGSQRLAGAPDIPTTVESGFPEFVVDAWYAIAAPAGTPPEIIARLNAEIRKVLDTPEAQEVLRSEGLTAKTNSPEEMATYVKSEYQRWGRVVKAAGIKPE